MVESESRDKARKISLISRPNHKAITAREDQVHDKTGRELKRREEHGGWDRIAAAPNLPPLRAL